MKRRICLLALLTLAVFWVAQGIAADNETDANIVTAIDISDSVPREELEGVISALASAISSPVVIRAIQSGPTGRVGFSVFAWHHYQYSFVDWMLIASENDAKLAAEQIRARILINVEPETSRVDNGISDQRTDISSAIDFGSMLLEKAPYKTRRPVINVIGNGIDNVGEHAGPARDRFVQTGGTVNGFVFGDDLSVPDYFERQVVGGPGAFLITIDANGDLANAFSRKFLKDIAFLPAAHVGSQPLKASDFH